MPKKQKSGSKKEPKITESKPKIRIIEKEESEEESGLEEEVEEASEELHEEGTRMLSSSLPNSHIPSQIIPEFPESQVREEENKGIVRYQSQNQLTEEDRMRGYEGPQEERLVIHRSGMEQQRNRGNQIVHTQEDWDDNDLIRRNNMPRSEGNFQNPDDKKYEHQLPNRKKKIDMY
ncbi:MAG: hypothetical protein Q8L29_01220 [archaeon]|nr:hypothetical protein [archaeon]